MTFGCQKLLTFDCHCPGTSYHHILDLVIPLKKTYPIPKQDLWSPKLTTPINTCPQSAVILISWLWWACLPCIVYVYPHFQVSFLFLQSSRLNESRRDVKSINSRPGAFRRENWHYKHTEINYNLEKIKLYSSIEIILHYFYNAVSVHNPLQEDKSDCYSSLATKLQTFWYHPPTLEN